MTTSDDAVLIVASDVVAINESGVWSVVGNDHVSCLNRRVVFDCHVLSAVDDREESSIASEPRTVDVLKQVVGDPHATKACVSWCWWFVPAKQQHAGADITDDVINELNVFNDCREAGITRAWGEHNRASSLGIGPIVLKNVAFNDDLAGVFQLEKILNTPTDPRIRRIVDIP